MVKLKKYVALCAVFMLILPACGKSADNNQSSSVSLSQGQTGSSVSSEKDKSVGRYVSMPIPEIKSSRIDAPWGYDTLNEIQKRIYDIMDGGTDILPGQLETYQYYLCLPKAISSMEYRDVYALYALSTPESDFGFYSFKPDTWDKSDDEDVREIIATRVEFDTPEGGVRQYLDRVNAQTSQWLEIIPKDADKAQACQLICRVIADNVSKPSDQQVAQADKSVSNFSGVNPHNPMRSADGAILGGEAVCGGYAGAFQMLAQRMGIETIIVYNDEHIWNMVRIDDNWYHVDPTWYDTDEVGIYDESCLLVSDEILLRDHDYPNGQNHYYYAGEIPPPHAPKKFNLGVLI